MKTILLILSLTLSASAATLYPVLTDNSGRTFTGGATNLALLSATNQTFVGTNTFNTNTILGTAKLQDTLDSKPTVALTNVARLDQSQTFTQTNTFTTNSILGTNRVGDFLGEGARWRRLYLHPATNWTPTASSAETNLLFSFTLPPLLSAYSEVKWRALAWRTNATSQPSFFVEFRANSTNGPTITGAFSFLAASAFATSPLQPSGASLYQTMLNNCGSYTRQICYGSNYYSGVVVPPFNLEWDTTQSTNTVNVMLIQTSAAGTNRVDFEFFEFLERY